MLKHKLLFSLLLLFILSSCEKQGIESTLNSNANAPINFTGILVMDQGVCYEDGSYQTGLNISTAYNPKTGREYHLTGSQETMDLVNKSNIGDNIQVSGNINNNGQLKLSFYSVVSSKGKPTGSGGGGNGGGGSGSNTRSVLLIRMSSPQFPSNTTEAEVNEMMFTATNSVKTFYETVSEGSVILEGEIVSFDNMPNTTETCPSNTFRYAANDQLAALGYDISSYDHLVYLFSFTCSVCGHNSKGSPMSRVWCITPKTIAHEMGHSLGLEHSTSPTWEYGDSSCTMGWTYVEFNAVKKVYLGYASKVNVSKRGGTYDIVSGSNHSTSGNKACVLTSGNSKYYISYRSKNGVFDTGLHLDYFDKVNIHVIDGKASRSIFLGSISLGEQFSIDAYTVTFDGLSNDVATVTVSK